MTPPIRLCASLACADWLHLERDLASLAAAGVDLLHFDVMDGAFVPNFALSLDLLRVVRGVTLLPIDAHLMIERPERYLDRFVEAGADVVVIHQEATAHVQRALAQVRALGARAGLALNPATPLTTLDEVWDDLDLLLIMTVNPGFAGQRLVPATLDKVARTRRMAAARGLALDIQVDGNVSWEHIPRMVAAGANWLVGGSSSLFAPGLGRAEAAMRMRDLAVAARSACACLDGGLG